MSFRFRAQKFRSDARLFLFSVIKIEGYLATPSLRWHHERMKSFFLFAVLTIAVSIACSGYKSAGSPTVLNNNAPVTEVPTQNESAATQEKVKCALTRASIAGLNGPKLGMTSDEVLALFPGSKDDPAVKADLARPPSKLGTSTLLIQPGKYGSKDKFPGIGQFTFILLDGHVSDLSIHYNGPEYSHVDKFVAKFVEGTSLPSADQWDSYAGLDSQMKTLTCADFEIRVYAGGDGGSMNSVTFKDLSAEIELKDRRKKARAQASPTP